jgi:hypothetical protein
MTSNRRLSGLPACRSREHAEQPVMGTAELMGPRALRYGRGKGGPSDVVPGRPRS